MLLAASMAANLVVLKVAWLVDLSAVSMVVEKADEKVAMRADQTELLELLWVEVREQWMVVNWVTLMGNRKALKLARKSVDNELPAQLSSMKLQ